YGAPAGAIVEAARVQKADLITMSTHGRSGLGRLILGSVAEAVLRGTTTPLEGPIVAEGILPFIIEIAGPLDIEVVLVRVMVPVPPSVIEGSRHVEVEDPEKRRGEGEAYLTR